MSSPDITLFHHPMSRAASVVWMLEEVGQPYTLQHVDIRAGEQRRPALRGKNAMSKVPTLVDGELVVTESAAIGLYLADRYAPGSLAPALDDPARGTYLRWSVYAPAVIEPGCMAKAAGWAFQPGSAGWGRYEDMLEAMEAAIGDGPWLLGERFTMADVIFGSTVGFMLDFSMIEARPSFTAYRERLDARPARQKAEAINAKIIEEQQNGGSGG